MDVKELNKSQLIMLAILLSFITSIATGIVTVSLMQQMPVNVVAPINRFVQQTVEKIAPNEGKNPAQTVVVKEEDLIVDAIAKNQSAVFSITKEIFDDSGKVVEVSAGRGFAISKDGIVVADGISVPGKEVYYVKNDSGKFKADFVSNDKAGFSFLKIGAAVDGKSKLNFSTPIAGDLSKMKAGQKIIILGDSIASFMFDGSKDIKMNVTKNNAGGAVLDLDGDALGISLSNDIVSFASIGSISEALKAIQNPNASVVPKVQ